jgi:hypothetical protein
LHAFGDVAPGAIDSISGVFGTTRSTAFAFVTSRLRAGIPASPQSVPSSVLLNFFMTASDHPLSMRSGHVTL